MPGTCGDSLQPANDAERDGEFYPQVGFCSFLALVPWTLDPT